MYHCAVMLTDLCQGDGRVLVDELLLMFQSSDIDFEIILRHLTTGKQNFQLVSKQRDVELKRAGFSPEVMRFGALGSFMQPVLYEKDVVSVLQKQISLALDEKIIVF